MTHRYSKAMIVGATIAAVLSVAVHVGMQAFVFGHGESPIGWLLLLPYSVMSMPGFYVAKMIGWYPPTGFEPAIMPIVILTIITNALIGAFLGWAFKKICEVSKRDA